MFPDPDGTSVRMVNLVRDGVDISLPTTLLRTPIKMEKTEKQ